MPDLEDSTLGVGEREADADSPGAVRTSLSVTDTEHIASQLDALQEEQIAALQSQLRQEKSVRVAMEQREGDHLRDKKELEDKLANLEEVCVPMRVRCVIHVAQAYGYTRRAGVRHKLKDLHAPTTTARAHTHTPLHGRAWRERGTLQPTRRRRRSYASCSHSKSTPLSSSARTSRRTKCSRPSPRQAFRRSARPAPLSASLSRASCTLAP
jgi:hypothetical protein